MFSLPSKLTLVLSCLAISVAALPTPSEGSALSITSRVFPSFSGHLVQRQIQGANDSLFPQDLDDLLGECADDCTTFVQKLNDTQCLSDVKCLCSNDFGSAMAKCGQCALGQISDSDERAAETKSLQDDANEVVSECKNSGNEISAINIAGSGKDGAAFGFQAPMVFLAMSSITFTLLL